jgi:SAM-dependent methyltransferase
MVVRSAAGRLDGGWAEYWDGLAPRRLFAEQARDHVRRLRSVVPLCSSDRVLDFGCGFGHVVELLAPEVSRIDYWDAAERMRRATAQRTAHLATAAPVDLGPGVHAPVGGYDLILVNSVIQYMSASELAGWLVRWNGMLRATGQVVLSDVPAPGTAALPELLGVLRFAATHRILLRTVLDGVAEADRYLHSRRRGDLQRWQPAELARRVAGAGLVAEVLPANLTHFRSRFSMVLRRP